MDTLPVAGASLAVAVVLWLLMRDKPVRIGGAPKLELEQVLNRQKTGAESTAERPLPARHAEYDDEDEDAKYWRKIEEKKQARAVENATKLKASEVRSREQALARTPMKSRSTHPGSTGFLHWYASVCELYRLAKFGADAATGAILGASERGQVDVYFHVTNKTRTEIEVFWVDYKGKEVPKGKMRPGGDWEQSTWIGHPWMFRTAAGAPLLQYIPTRIFQNSAEASSVDNQGVGQHRFSIVSSEPGSDPVMIVEELLPPLHAPVPAHNAQLAVWQAVRWCIAQMARENADPTLLVKYLCNIVKDPANAKFRQIRIANEKFWKEVWITAGRGVLLALGFQDGGKFVEIGEGAGGAVLPAARVEELRTAVKLLREWQARCQTAGGAVAQPAGADGFGRAGYGRAGMINVDTTM